MAASMSKRENDQISYRNRKKLNMDFINKDLRRSNCYNCDFTGSNFNYVSFRGAQFKSCNFDGCTFESAEFITSNFKNSNFKQVKFENTLFDSVNLEGADFEGAEFKNVIFVSTDIEKATHLDLSNQDIKVFDEMPELQISKALEKVTKAAMTNEYIKFARVLDTKEGEISPISMMILSEKFDEEILVKGLRLLKKKVDKDFCTLSFIIQSIQAYQVEGLI